MPRIVGVDVPENKKLVYALTYIKGIGLTTAKEIVAKLDLDPDMRAKNLNEDDTGRLTSLIDKEYVVEGELNRKIKDNITRLITIMAAWPAELPAPTTKTALSRQEMASVVAAP